MKIYFLLLLKYLGIFFLCKTLNAQKLRILCYHGISLADEHEFSPGLFIPSDKFRRHMEMLNDGGYSVLPLDYVPDFLEEAQATQHGTVITIDDGWYGTYKFAVPILSELGLPATIYLTTYYAEKELPVFNVLVNYLFWRTKLSQCDFDQLGFELTGQHDISDSKRREEAADAVRAMDKHLNSAERDQLSRQLEKSLGVDVSDQPRLMTLMTLDEVRRAAKMDGIDIQLHTHRHRMGKMTRDEILTEVSENRAIIQQLLQTELKHFCYPSGNYSPSVWPYLEELGVETATTVTNGFVTNYSHRYGLSRIVINDNVSDIEFEAEICGVIETFRTVRASLGL